MIIFYRMTFLVVGKEANETARFAQLFDKFFFDIINVSNLTSGA